MQQAMEIGLPVAVVLGFFKIIEMLIAKLKPSNGVGQLRLSLGEIEKNLALVAQSLEGVSVAQRSIAAAMQQHQVETAAWLGKGCRNLNAITAVAEDLRLQVLRLKDLNS